jgi:F0F1-type ATP synthase epsilon subunit
MRVYIISDREPVYENEAFSATLPGHDGEFSVMDFHQPFLYRLRKGLMKIKEKEDEDLERHFEIKDGLARFHANALAILCELR